MNFDDGQNTDTSSVSSRFAVLVDMFASKKEASAVSGKSVDMLASYASGKRDAPFGIVAELAKTKGVSLDWIATGIGPMMLEDVESGDPRLANPELFTAAFYDTVDHLKIHGRKNTPSSEFVRLLFIENLRASAQSLAELEAEAAAEAAASKETSDVHN